MRECCSRVLVSEALTQRRVPPQPAVEPVVHVTIVPREKFPLGQTVLKVNEQRELTYQFTRRYLQEQLLTVLAGAPLMLLLLATPTVKHALCSA